MSVSSRTPEGLPHRCPLWGKEAAIEFSAAAEDACCPTCGHLLWWFRDRLSAASGIPLEEIAGCSLLVDDLRLDSLAVIELVMQFEEQFNLHISDELASEVRSVEELVRYIRRLQEEGPG